MSPLDCRSVEESIDFLRKAVDEEAKDNKRDKLLVTAAVSAAKSKIDAGYDIKVGME